MEDKKVSLSFGSLCAFLKQFWWLILLAFIIGSALMAVYCEMNYKEVYTASVSICVMENVESESSYKDRIWVYNAHHELESDQIALRVKELDPLAYGGMTVSQLRSRVTSYQKDSYNIVLSATAETKEKAIQLANDWGNAFQTYANETYFGEERISYDKALTATSNMTFKSILICVAKSLLSGVFCAGMMCVMLCFCFAVADKKYIA